MNLLLTSNIPNPIITPDEVRNMVLAMAEVNLSLPDYVSKVIIGEADYGEFAFKIYARHFRIPVASLDDTIPDAVLEIGVSNPGHPSACERAAKTKGVPYLFMQIPETTQIGIIAHVDNGEKVMITAEKAEQILLTDTPA